METVETVTDFIFLGSKITVDREAALAWASLAQRFPASSVVARVILKPKKMKSVTVSIVSPSICHEVMGPDALIFVF